MHNLNEKRVLLGVSGGIAAYKSADLVRRLREVGADVRVVMSSGAQAFVTPLTFQATSGNPVHTALLDESAEAGMGHIELARWAELILVAPASANRIAALATGMADDLLSTLCLASDAPLFVAPAMNQAMWNHIAVQDNISTLKKRGVHILGPGEGDQACGDVGAGRMLEPLQLREALLEYYGSNDRTLLDGVSVLITAGPTREAIDPVRYISNHSSGKMGFAIADAAQRAGAKVTLIAGPVSLGTPPGVERIDVSSALDMHSAVMSRVGQANIFIAVAAVADYRAREMHDNKIKKSSETLTIELERNPDILADVAAEPDGPLTVGFAAETRDVESYARGKLQKKNIDMIAANHVGIEGSGFSSDHNSLIVLSKDGSKTELPHSTKTALANQLIALIASNYKK